MEKKKRIEEIDIMKGVGIVLIAVYHLVYRSMDGIPDNMIRSLGWAFIGIFFLISGYTCKPDAGILSSYKKRLMGLIIPVFLIEFLLIALGGLYCVLFHGYTSRDIVHDAAVTFLRPEITTKISETWGEGGTLFLNLSPVWFIWSMGWTELIFHPLRKIFFGRGELQWVLLLALLIGIQIPMYLYLDPAPWSLIIVPVFIIFMAIGTKLREWDAVERLRKIPAIHAAWITVVCFVVHYGLFMFNGNESYYQSVFGNRGALDVFTVILQLIVIMPAMFFIARGLKQIRYISKCFIWLGQHSLPILLMHCIFGLVYSDLFKTYSKLGSYWYLEYQGLTLTADVVLKSIIICILSLASCVPLVILWEKLRNIIFKKRLENDPVHF